MSMSPFCNKQFGRQFFLPGLSNGLTATLNSIVLTPTRCYQG